MGTTYRFIEAPSDVSAVLAWFRALALPPKEILGRGGMWMWLHFDEFGPLLAKGDGDLDRKCSPLATFFPPRIRRGVLWTVGEVHFLSTPLRRLFPALHRISKDLGDWLARQECVVQKQRARSVEEDYCFEGSVKNYDSPVFGFPSGVEALRKGQYFVGDGDSELMLAQLCRKLRLRGVHCTDEPK